jgi:hypothetical protein
MSDDPNKPPDPPDVTLDSFEDENVVEMRTTVKRKFDDSSNTPTHSRAEPHPPPLKKDNNVNVSYRSDSPGPYTVYIQNIEDKPLRPMTFGQMLMKDNISGIITGGLKKEGRNKISLNFLTPKDANSFVTSDFIIKNKFKAYIPTFKLTRMGIVRGFDVDLTEEKILKYTTAPEISGRILKARRLNRKDISSGEIQWIPSQTVVFTFEGQILPRNVYIFHNSLKVELYSYPTSQCYSCGRFGHISKSCRSAPRCVKCAEHHLSSTCDLPVGCERCVNCKGNHAATSSICPYLKREKEIKLVMSKDSISYKDATERVPLPRSEYADAVKSTSQALTQSQTPPLRSYIPHSLKSTKTPTRIRKPVNLPLNDKKSTDSLLSYTNNQLLNPQNGCAFNVPKETQMKPQEPTLNSEEPYAKVMEMMAQILFNVISSMPDAPSNVASSLPFLLNILNQFSSSKLQYDY